MPTLADLYSAIGTAKRKASDFVQNPMMSLGQMAGNANDRARVLNEMTAAAAEEKDLYGPASRALGQKLAEAYNPIGMTVLKGLPKDYYELNTLATQAYADLRKAPSKEAKDKYVALMEARDNAANNPSKNYVPPTPDEVADTYKGQHLAPTKGSGKPLHDLTDVYPDDFYSFEAPRLYGHGENELRDARIIRQIQSLKDRPNRPVTIYRAVPKDTPRGTKINQGDWVTTDREYAVDHGMGALKGEYKIIKQTAKARDLFTNGDSIYEMGYDPQPYIPRSQR